MKSLKEVVFYHRLDMGFPTNIDWIYYFKNTLERRCKRMAYQPQILHNSIGINQ